MRFTYEVDKGEYKAEIVVAVYDISSKLDYRIVDLGIKEKRKRKYEYRSKIIRDDYFYRGLDTEGRKQYIKDDFLKYVSPEDIYNALTFAYEKLKPSQDQIDYWIG